MLPLPRLVALFALGALISPLGDHIHVATGTTTYLHHDRLMIGSSPVWFPLFVGVGTAALAQTRVLLGPPRSDADTRRALLGIALVMTEYAATGLLRGQPDALGLTLIGGLAAVTWCVVGDGRAAVCGAIAAVVGTGTEAVLVAAGRFEYAADSDQLIGVAPWLPALYFGFGVSAAVLGELAADRGAQPALTA